MKFTVTIESDNQEAVDNPRALVNMVLTDIAGRVREYIADSGVIKDSNGNNIGRWELTI